MPDTSLSQNDHDVQTVVRVESKLRGFYDALAPDEQAVLDTLLDRAFDADSEVAGYAALNPLATKGWTWFPSSPSFHIGATPPDPCLPEPGQISGPG